MSSSRVRQPSPSHAENAHQPAPEPSAAMEFLDAVLAVVERIPAGRVTTYGVIAETVHAQLGRGGPRQVGTVMAKAGGGVPWWRVVNAAGRPPLPHTEKALTLLREEGVTLTADGCRVVLAACGWEPAEEEDQPPAVVG